MRLLLDTHVLVWMYGEPERLSRRTRAALQSATNEIYVSVVVAWELGIKLARKKLTLPGPLPEFLLHRIQHDRLRVLPIGLQHVLDSVALPEYHADPFDRMLIAQARIEDLTLITADPEIGRYDVKRLAA